MWGFLGYVSQQIGNIQNQSDGPTPEDRESSQSMGLTKHFAEWFDHGLKLPLQTINHQAGTQACVLHNDNVFAVTSRLLHIKHVA